MNHTDIKSNDPLQLKQTIIYLQAELNKYKSKKRQSSSSLIDELHLENEKLSAAYKELLHKNKKHEKRINLYERRIQSLQAQRKESLSILPSIDLSEIMNAFESLEGKVDTLLHRNDDHDQLSLAEEKVSRLQDELSMTKKVNAALYELIVILEEYIQQMKKEADAQKALVKYMNERIDALTSGQNN